MPSRKLRILVAKPGLDGHDRGAKIIARALRDAGDRLVDSVEHSAPRRLTGRLNGATISVYEVGPRDGLQNELRTLASKDKVKLIEALVRAGLKRIEASSFVSPRWIPQLADA